MKSRNIAALIITFGTATVLGACTSGKSEEARTAEKVISRIVAEVISPVSDQPLYPLSLPGELKPFEQVNIFAKAKGFVKMIYVDRGSKVKKGQLLAILEAPEISQQHLAVQSNERKLYENFFYSRQAYKRLLKASLKNGAVAEIELDRAKSQLRSDSAAYHSARASTGASAQLKDYLRITAPFSGIIVSRNVSVGALVGDNNSSPLFSVAQQERLRLTVAVPEKHAHSMTKNIDANFSVSNRPGKMYKAPLSRNSGLLDQESRSMAVEFDVDNRDHLLSGGEYAQVKLMLKRPDSTLWLPVTSVVQAQSGVFVLKVENGITKRIPVTLGIRNKELQEIFGEVTSADKILKTGTEELQEGTPVQIRN